MIKNYLDNQITVEKFFKKCDLQGRFNGGDKRGKVAMFLSNNPVEFVEYTEFKKEKIERGFHFHKQYIEFIYIIKGKLIFIAKSLQTNKQIKIVLTSGNLLKINPNIAHAFLSLEQTQVISAGHGPSPFVDRHSYKNLPF